MVVEGGMSSKLRTPPKNAIAQVFWGGAYPLRAILFIARHRLWSLTFAAVAVHLVLFSVSVWAIISFVLPWVREITDQLAIGSGLPWLQGILSAVGWLLWFVAGAIVVALDALLVLAVGEAVASPFLERLSEAMEAIVTESPASAGSVSRALRSIALAVSDLVAGLTIWAAAHLPLFFLGAVIPGIGTVLASGLSFCLSAWLLAHEFVTLPQTRRLISYRRRFRTAWRNR